MGKYHINKHGIPAVCKAKEGNCPLGGDEQHFNSKEKAQAHVDTQNEQQFGILGETLPSRPLSHNIDRHERINNLIENMGADQVANELAKNLSENELQEFNVHIINSQYLKNDINPYDDSLTNFEKIKNKIGEKEAIQEMTQYFSSIGLHENIDIIEQDWSIENNNHIDNSEYKKELDNLLYNANKYTEGVLEETERLLEELDEIYG